MSAESKPERRPADGEPDAALAAAACSGSRDAFGLLVERYRDRLFRFLRMRCGSHEDAEELLQESMLRAWSRLHLFDLARPFSTWLFTLAARLAVSHGRRGHLTRSDEEAVLGATASAAADPALACERADQTQNVWDVALRVLRPHPRTVLWLYYGEQRSTPEIAEILGKRDDAVRAALARARRALSCYFAREESRAPLKSQRVHR